MESRISKKVYISYFVLIAAACASFVFTNISYDAEYQFAMAYRMIKGDVMIQQMWEPHQTSAFLCAILMKAYMAVTGTTTGIVLYTQVAGLLIRAVIAWLFYKMIKETSGEVPAVIVGCIYLLISPKELLTPEFGNMQLWFATLMFLALVKYFKCYKWIYLVLSAVSLCLGVLSYPSIIIVYFAAVIILCKYSENPKKDVGIFTGTCALIGGIFVLYLLLTVGLDIIIQCLQNALALEPTHTVSFASKTLAHVLNIAKVFGMLAAVGLIGGIIECAYSFICSCKNKVKFNYVWSRWLISSWYVLMVFLLLNILSVKNRGGYSLPFLVIILVGFAKRDMLSKEEKKIYYSAFGISIMSLLATLILSDNAFIQAITYMLILICVSILPLYHWLKSDQISAKLCRLYVYGLHLLAVLIIFRCVYIHIPIYGRSQIFSILDDVALIRSGPAIGIITDEEGAARQRDSMAEWKKYIKPGDTIWILGEPVDTLGYLYEDVEVGAPTVMSTPTYNEALLYYWELNPDKYPDAVIVASSFGNLDYVLSLNTWLMEWLEEEYCADTVIDGNFWRYYLKN